MSSIIILHRRGLTNGFGNRISASIIRILKYIFRLSFSLLQVTPDELRTLIAKYNNVDAMATSGITIAGIKYMYLSSNDKVIRAKKGMNGVHTIKTTQSKFQVGIQDD